MRFGRLLQLKCNFAGLLTGVFLFSGFFAASAAAETGAAIKEAPKTVNGYVQIDKFDGLEDFSWVPRTLKKAPEFKSEKVRYNIWVLGDGNKSVMVMAWDESQGTGKGYDTLYVDNNFNGDLTEDGKKHVIIKSDKWPKESFDPIEGIKEADGNKTFSFKLISEGGNATIGYPSSYSATWPGCGLAASHLPGNIPLKWSNDLKTAPIYRFGGSGVYFFNDKLPGTSLGTWSAGETPVISWAVSLLGDKLDVFLRGGGGKISSLGLLRVLDKTGAVLEDIPFQNGCV